MEQTLFGDGGEGGGGGENDICEDECALLEQTLASLFSPARANGSSSP